MISDNSDAVQYSSRVALYGGIPGLRTWQPLPTHTRYSETAYKDIERCKEHTWEQLDAQAGEALEKLAWEWCFGETAKGRHAAMARFSSGMGCIQDVQRGKKP